jgi:3'-5' exoribonuclease
MLATLAAVPYKAWMHRFLSHCAPGDMIEDVYVVSGKQLSPTNNNKHFIKAFVSDRSAQVTARMWNATPRDFKALPESGFVFLRAKIENYQNNLQCVIEQFAPAEEGTFDIADLLPQTRKNIPRMYARACEILGSVQNRHLAALLQAYLDDEKLMTDFCRAPAAMSFHHAYVGGLLEHTLNAMEVADVVCGFYPGLNRDMVIAGIFLHDIAKTWELSYDCAFGYTDGGQLVGHIVKSVLWVEEKRTAAEAVLGERIPQALIDVLQHIIISHHDKPEFGSPKTPATPEAIAVHQIENLDAKLMMSLSATRGEPAAAASGHWTEYMKAFGGRLYRPDVAPAEYPAEEEPPAPCAPAAGPVGQGPQPVERTSPPDRRNGTTPARPADALQITNPLFDTSLLKGR